MKLWLAIVLGSYLLALLGVSLLANRRVHDEEDYLVAGRRLPLWLAWGTLLATWFGAATMLGAADAAREEGLRGTILDPFASGCALIVAGLCFAKPLWEMRLLTLSDFYARKYGRATEFVASAIMVPGYFGWIAAQYLALASLQESFFGIDPRLGIVLGAAIVLSYTLMGGMWSVTLTDTLQIVVVLITLLVMAGVTLSHLGLGSMPRGLTRLFDETPADYLTLLPEAALVPIVMWLSTWGNGIFGNIPGQDLLQRVFASKDATTAARACILAGVVYLAFGLLPVGMGLASRILVPENRPGGILPILAHEYLSPLMAAIFLVSLVSIIVSTCTSAVLSPAAVLGHNVLSKLSFIKLPRLAIDRLAVLLVAGAGLATAYSGKTILELLELSLSISFVTLFVPLVAGLYGRPRGELPALLAMLCGGVIWLLREVLEGVWLPPPEEMLAADYPGYVARSITSIRGLQPLAFGFALLPSGISGTIASMMGYLAGQWMRGAAWLGR